MLKDAITVKQSVHGHIDLSLGGMDLDLLDDLLELALEGVSDTGTVFNNEATRTELHETGEAIRAAIERFRSA